MAATALGALWGLWFPINKALWTSSYALFTGGLAALALAACYWLIEARGVRRWAEPFAWFGVNALALFFLSTLAAKLLLLIRVGPEATRLHAWLFQRLFAPWAAPPWMRPSRGRSPTCWSGGPRCGSCSGSG